MADTGELFSHYPSFGFRVILAYHVPLHYQPSSACAEGLKYTVQPDSVQWSGIFPEKSALEKRTGCLLEFLWELSS